MPNTSGCLVHVYILVPGLRKSWQSDINNGPFKSIALNLNWEGHLHVHKMSCTSTHRWQLRGFALSSPCTGCRHMLPPVFLYKVLCVLHLIIYSRKESDQSDLACCTIQLHCMILHGQWSNIRQIPQITLYNIYYIGGIWYMDLCIGVCLYKCKIIHVWVIGWH